MNKPSMPAPKLSAETDYDIVVIGGSFSGSSTAWMIKREHPDAKVLIIERSTEFDRKVGESTSEVAGAFLHKVLRLGPHLSQQHVPKHGLHIWHNDETNTCPTRCTQIGPDYQVRLPTYQVSRNILDQHLLERSVKTGSGCELVRPATVRDMELAENDDPHKVTFKDGDGNERTVSTRWVIDASGRAAAIARHRKTFQKLPEHPINAMWTRFTNVRDFDTAEMDDLHEGDLTMGHAPRFNSTNHLVGYGWWCWLISLENGEMSAGLTWDPRLFTPPKDGKIAERLKAHLLTHPIGKALFENAEPVESDSRTFSDLPFYSSEPAGNRWISVGDAAGFMDPLYSQGLDYCAHSTYIGAKIVKKDLHGMCQKEELGYYNSQFVQSYFRWFNAIYKDKYTYIGDADLMHAAFLLDLGTYFVGPVRLVYDETDSEFSHMPYHGKGGTIFAKFMAFYNRRFAHIARKKLAAGKYGNHNLDKSWLIEEGFAPDFSAFRQIRRGIRVWLREELRVLFYPNPKPMPSATTAPAAAEEAQPAAV